MHSREHAAEPSASPARSPADPPLILIVDDEESIAETLALIVHDAGYAPVVASNGRQALELARTHWPALVLTDMMMPLLDGPGLIAALREAAAADGRHMPPLMVLTAGGMAEARATGADVVLRKPFDLDVLKRYIAGLLAREAD